MDTNNQNPISNPNSDLKAALKLSAAAAAPPVSRVPNGLSGFDKQSAFPAQNHEIRDGAAPAKAQFPLPAPFSIGAAWVTPAAMQEYLQQLEGWALGNERDSRRDAFKFWSFKIPGIFAASGSGLIAALNLPPLVTIILGLISSICIALDGIVRPGKLRSVHIRAFHDLRNLQNVIKNQWLISTLQGNGSDASAAMILATAEIKRLEIATYLQAVEAAPLDSALTAPSQPKQA